jgi:hypothetical protein
MDAEEPLENQLPASLEGRPRQEMLAAFGFLY